MIIFDDDYVARLNANYSGGKFLKAIILTEDTAGPVLKYWVDLETSIEFDGHTYEPLHMRFDAIRTSQGMMIEGANISVSNLGNQAVRYVKELDISGNPVTVQILHLDLLSTLTSYWQRHYKILGVQADRQTATFSVGRQLGRNRLPRRVYLRSLFPGLTSDVPRIF